VVALEAITALGLLPGPDALLDQGFRDDSLLSDYPLQLNAVVFFLDHLRNALRLADPAIQALLADKEHLLTLLPKLQAIFQPS
jgi:hypothetical protein